MKEDFYRERLVDKYGLDVLIPSSEDMEAVHRIIYDELCAGVINSSSMFRSSHPAKGIIF